MKRLVGMVLGGIVLMGCCCNLVGCGPEKAKGVAGLPAEYQGLPQVLTDSIRDQGVLKDWLVKARARGLRPGVEFHVTSDNSAGVRLSGIAAEAEGEAVGEGYANVPGEIMQYILDQAKSGDENAAALLRTWFEGRAAWKPGPNQGGGTASTTQPAS